MRKFVSADAGSKKFWTIDLRGARHFVTFGQVGSKGQTRLKEFADEAAARAACDRAIAEKLAQGYVETFPAAASAAPPSLRRSLEQALAEAPDDLAAHSAYADFLMEQGDPRGELIQAQLALEDPARPADQRARLREREAELLGQHAREWLGDVGRFLVGEWSGADKPYHYAFARGWLDFLRVLPWPDAVLAALAHSPEAALLRRLEVVYDMRYHPFDFDPFTQGPEAALRADEKGGAIYEECTILPPLLASPYLTNLRAFKLGFSDDGEEVGHSTMIGSFMDCSVGQILDLLRRNPRLEELYLNTNMPNIAELFAAPELEQLRVLQYYYGSEYAVGEPNAYPMTALANNPAAEGLTALRLHAGRETTIGLDELKAVLESPHLAGLTHLQARMSTFGDAVCQAVIDSGALRRLKVLDLGWGSVTDAGAERLAACPDVDNLEVLDLTRNALTAIGVRALRAAGARVVADNQHAVEDEDYLFEVDYE